MRRKVWYDRLKERKLRLINVVDKSAIISPQAKIGTGCFFGKFSVVNAGATVHNDCIINTRALVEHGCEVFSHVSCSVTIGQLQIGEWSTIGAGAVVTKNIDSGVTAAGVPARVISKNTMLG